MKRILLYEPSDTFARFVRYVLTRLGYEVFHVQDSKQVMTSITTTMPDLIIAEANIAGLNGIELCRKLKQERMLSIVPVAIISVDGTIESRVDAHNAGCVDYLTKPLTARALHELAERHLPFHNKRNYIRTRMHINAEVSDGVRSESMQTLSIGEGGMYACTAHPFPVGTNLKMSLPLPSLRSALEVKGEVIYTTEDNQSGVPMGMGIKFIGMDSNTVTLLRHYMESYLSDYVPE